jgi:hypothetical protein
VIIELVGGGPFDGRRAEVEASTRYYHAGWAPRPEDFLVPASEPVEFLHVRWTRRPGEVVEPIHFDFDGWSEP